jgi:hypothetical protein
MPPTSRQVSNIDRLKILSRCVLTPVPSYRFGDCREEVGRLELADDDEALAFGEAIIRDLKRGDAGQMRDGLCTSRKAPASLECYLSPPA